MVSNSDSLNEEAREAHVLTLEQFGSGSPTQSHDKPPAQSTERALPTGTAPVSKRRLYMMVMADFGLAFTWLCKFAVATPYFQHSLKAGPFLSHLVWIMGPLSGLVVAPVVGVLSDRCTSPFGRRRPFMLGGTISCIIGMNLFANAAKISFGYLPIARMVAVLAFGILDFSTNAIMFPSRALMGDLLPADQQHAVQSAAAVVASLAEICGGVYIFSWKDPVTQISQIFIVASVLMAISCGITLFVCKETALRADSVELVVMEEARNTESAAETGVGGEGGMEPSRGENEKPHATVNESEERGDVIEKENDEIDDEENALAMATREDENDAESEDHVVENVGEDEESYVGNGDQLSVWAELVTTVKATLNQFPRPLIKVGIVYGLAWFLWFASLPYYSQWLGVDVLQGDPGAEAGSPKAVLYQQGVSVFSVANVFKALLALVFSAYYPRIIKWVGAIGERVVFGMSFLVFSAVLFAFAYTKKVIVAASVIALGSVPFIVTQTIPIAIVVQRYPENLASNLGVMNLFCVVPQLVDTLYTGKVAEWAGESAVLRVAAGWGFAASLAAFCFL